MGRVFNCCWTSVIFASDMFCWPLREFKILILIYWPLLCDVCMLLISLFFCKVPGMPKISTTIQVWPLILRLVYVLNCYFESKPIQVAGTFGG